MSGSDHDKSILNTRSKLREAEATCMDAIKTGGWRKVIVELDYEDGFLAFSSVTDRNTEKFKR